MNRKVKGYSIEGRAHDKLQEFTTTLNAIKKIEKVVSDSAFDDYGVVYGKTRE